MSNPTGSFNATWCTTLQNLLTTGQPVNPRGIATRELPQGTIVVDMRYPVLTTQERKLSYRFMAAEAYWILSGDNTVSGIAPWNNNIERFSDDGETFFGAYGPRIVSQLDYVVDKLRFDPDTRQAGLTIWRENPPATKDVPCTVAMFVQLRDSKLNLHVFMRSSDVWLGLPYDVFSFSMLGHLICTRLNEGVPKTGMLISPGTLHLTAASSHLYETNVDAAQAVLAAHNAIGDNQSITTPEFMYKSSPQELLDYLAKLRNTSAGDFIRWWEWDNEIN
jgi:thymidylate synthase